MESRGKRIVGELWEQIPFLNLQYLFPVLKAQLDNIYKYPFGFGFANFIFGNVCFCSVLTVFSASEDGCHLSSNLTMILNLIFP